MDPYVRWPVESSWTGLDLTSLTTPAAKLSLAYSQNLHVFGSKGSINNSMSLRERCNLL